MRNERLALKGKLQELKHRKLELAAKAQGCISALDAQVLPLAVIPLDSMDTGAIKAYAQDLDVCKQEYVQVCKDIKEIEAALE